MKNYLLIIDPQNDFADPRGALAVLGADADMVRMAGFVSKNGADLDRIHVTLDSHHLMHIANPGYWRDSNGQHPKPFTVITSKDVKDGTWSPQDVWGSSYLEKLEADNKYPHVIWPPHCLIGSWGHGIFPFLFSALNFWEALYFKTVNMVLKGNSNQTEHFSAFRAEVPIIEEQDTLLNIKLLKQLDEADRIFVGGIAGSHCVANSIYNLAEFSPSLLKKVVLLRDTISPVPGFEQLQEDFIKNMTEQGMQVSNTDVNI